MSNKYQQITEKKSSTTLNTKKKRNETKRMKDQYSHEIISKTRTHEGLLYRIKHRSICNSCAMTFAIYIPDLKRPRVDDEEDIKLPMITYLSGLTCTDENVSQKGGAFKACCDERIIFLMPDTSARGHEEIEGENESWDFGTGAGFYVNASEERYKKNYNMLSYVTEEIMDVLKSIADIGARVDFDRISIMGHSMGGHGALTIAMRDIEKYRAVSAFAPIANPSSEDCPWGKKAFTGYFGTEDKEMWLKHDATEIVKSTEDFSEKKNFKTFAILIDQGDCDNFYQTQLYPERFVDACMEKKLNCTYNLRKGYDHSYWFISTFMENHIKFHAERLV